MPASPRPVIVLHPSGAFRERVRGVSGKVFRCSFLSSWDALRQAVMASPPAALLVVDPYEGSPREQPQLSSQLRALLWEFPSATVVAAMEILPGRTHDLRTLGEWGVTDIISLREDDTQEAIARRLWTARGKPLQDALWRSLPDCLSGRARMLLLAAAEVVATGGRGKDLARSLHLSERTVLRWSERAGLAPPRRILAWMRILLAALLLDDPGRTVLSVARACGYASDNSLRRAMHHFLRASPAALRREGAFTIAAEVFLAELADVRTWGKARLRVRRPAGPLGRTARLHAGSRVAFGEAGPIRTTVGV